MDAASIKLAEDKEIYTLKIGALYHGLVWDAQEQTLHITGNGVATALQAANAARKLKKYKDVGEAPKKKQAPRKNTIS